MEYRAGVRTPTLPFILVYLPKLALQVIGGGKGELKAEKRPVFYYSISA